MDRLPQIDVHITMLLKPSLKALSVATVHGHAISSFPLLWRLDKNIKAFNCG